jgi:hypothetical protein
MTDGSLPAAYQTIVSLQPVNELLQFLTTARQVQQDGTVDLGTVASGSYVLTALARPMASEAAPLLSALSSQESLNVTGASEIRARLDLIPPVAVSGTLEVVGARSADTIAGGSLQIEMVPGHAWKSALKTQLIPVNESGTFGDISLPSAEYQVRVRGREIGGATFTLDEVVVNGRLVRGETIQLTRPQALRVEATIYTTDLQGSMVFDPLFPLAIYSAAVFPADRATWLSPSMPGAVRRLSSDGRFEVKGLPPGNYLVSLGTDLDPSDLDDRDILDQLATTATPVSLKNGEVSDFKFAIRR